MKQLLTIGTICFGLFLLPAQASTIDWMIQGAHFTDGGTLSGTFATDSVTGALESYNFLTTAGGAYGGFEYTSLDSMLYANNTWTPNSFTIVDTSPYAYPILNLEFANPLNVGGTDSLVVGAGYGNKGGSFEVNNDWSNYRAISSGSAVPEPANIALLAIGLLGLGLTRRRKQ